MLHIGSLCSGYGGLDMAIQQVWNSEIVWFSEFDKFAAKVFEAHHPHTPNLGDLTKIQWESVPPVDILCAGYPCQPFSHAGNRKGQNDERHLWPYIKRGIGIIRPRICVFENVEGHLTLGFDQVLSDLAEMGYRVAWGVVAAADIGAPHRRNRLFILAYTDSYRHGEQQDPRGVGSMEAGDEGEAQQRKRARQEPDARNSAQRANTNSLGLNLARQTTNTKRNQGQSQFKPQRLGEAASHTNGDGLQTHNHKESQTQAGLNGNAIARLGEYSAACERWQRLTRPMPEPAIDGKLNPVFVEWLMGLPEGWVTDHANSPSQALKMLGNGVVPQQAEYALRHLKANLARF